MMGNPLSADLRWGVLIGLAFLTAGVGFALASDAPPPTPPDLFDPTALSAAGWRVEFAPVDRPAPDEATGTIAWRGHAPSGGRISVSHLPNTTRPALTAGDLADMTTEESYRRLGARVFERSVRNLTLPDGRPLAALWVDTLGSGNGIEFEPGGPTETRLARVYVPLAVRRDGAWSSWLVVVSLRGAADNRAEAAIFEALCASPRIPDGVEELIDPAAFNRLPPDPPPPARTPPPPPEPVLPPPRPANPPEPPIPDTPSPHPTARGEIPSAPPPPAQGDAPSGDTPPEPATVEDVAAALAALLRLTGPDSPPPRLEDPILAGIWDTLLTRLPAEQAAERRREIWSAAVARLGSPIETHRLALVFLGHALRQQTDNLLEHLAGDIRAAGLTLAGLDPTGWDIFLAAVGPPPPPSAVAERELAAFGRLDGAFPHHRLIGWLTASGAPPPGLETLFRRRLDGIWLPIRPAARDLPPADTVFAHHGRLVTLNPVRQGRPALGYLREEEDDFWALLRRLERLRASTAPKPSRPKPGQRGTR